MARFAIGVHAGNTTTSAVILQGRKIVAKAKNSATKNNDLNGVRTAIENVVDNFLSASSTSNTMNKLLTRRDVIGRTARITIGGNHFMNALTELKGLHKVGAIRLCGPSTRALPPFVDHPEQLQQKINGGYGLMQGGFECNKREISSVVDEEIAQKAEELWSKFGVRNFVVCGVFSPFDQSQEFQAANVIRNIYPNASITESHLVS